MLSKADIKYINSLQNKKSRKTEGAFFVEGHKNVAELLESDYEVIRLFYTPSYKSQFSAYRGASFPAVMVGEGELNGVGSLETNDSALAIARIKENKEPLNIFSPLVLVLDGINDPGNLGTIIRIADWYAIDHIICSTDTVDFYNPKVINASKGSFTRVGIFYTDLPVFIENRLSKDMRILAASMEGESVYEVKRFPQTALILGNEANGIRAEVLRLATDKITIPRRGQSESLNVGVAAGILADRLLN